MRLKDYPGCCSAKILCDFGETVTSFARTEYIDRKKLLRELMDVTAWTGGAFIVATTNSDQKEAAAVLRYVGFKRRKGVVGNHRRLVYEWYIETQVLKDNLRAIQAGTWPKKL